VNQRRPCKADKAEETLVETEILEGTYFDLHVIGRKTFEIRPGVIRTIIDMERRPKPEPEGAA
jgi:hypothetical protein